MNVSSVCHQSGINSSIMLFIYLSLFPDMHMYILLSFLLIYKNRIILHDIL